MSDEKNEPATEPVTERSPDAPDFADPAEFPSYDEKDAGEVEHEEIGPDSHSENAADPEAEH